MDAVESGARVVAALLGITRYFACRCPKVFERRGLKFSRHERVGTDLGP
jgi:hypothetical protein